MAALSLRRVSVCESLYACASYSALQYVAVREPEVLSELVSQPDINAIVPKRAPFSHSNHPLPRRMS